MIKFRWYYDIDKEEKFLNEMSRNGYRLKKYCIGFYNFEKTNENDYTYRIDLIQDKTDEQLHEYIELIKETGAEFIQTFGVWAYFRKKGNFELYTDADSQIDFYNRTKSMFLLLAIAELLISIGQWGMFVGNTKELCFFTAMLLDSVAIIFLYQVFKINKKIKILKKEKI